MKRSKRMLILLGVLAVACAATFGVLHLEKRQEQIKTSGETILEIPTEDVDALSWTYEGQTLSFHLDGSWVYDDDTAFPVDTEAVESLLAQFQPLQAAFVIEEAEDLGQYGLDDPICTISLATADKTYEILLGDFSTMDSQRYVSIGDGNVYLVAEDPMNAFDAQLSDMILNDEPLPESQVTELRFSGEDSYTVRHEEDNTLTYSDSDAYFTQQGGDTLALDTSKVRDYLSALCTVDLTDYVTYNATEEAIASYGLDDPELTVSVDYTAEDEDGESYSDTYVLAISRDPAELAAQDAKTDDSEDEEETITAYARVGDSPIIYRLTQEDYEDLTAASRDDLRHSQVFWGDTSQITQMDITLDGTDYVLSVQSTDDGLTFTYGEETVDGSDLESALLALSADSFTDETPDQQQEIAMTLHLDNENVSQVEIVLYRYDGAHCLAVVDGTPVSLVSRSNAADLTEAVYAIVLN